MSPLTYTSDEERLDHIEGTRLLGGMSRQPDPDALRTKEDREREAIAVRKERTERCDDREYA